jgi:hypothetical protein
MSIYLAEIPLNCSSGTGTQSKIGSCCVWMMTGSGWNSCIYVVMRWGQAVYSVATITDRGYKKDDKQCRWCLSLMSFYHKRDFGHPVLSV